MFVFAIVMGIALLSGWRPGDAKDIWLNRAFHRVIADGVRIEGVRQTPFGWLMIRLFADKEDSRLPLLRRPQTQERLVALEEPSIGTPSPTP